MLSPLGIYCLHERPAYRNEFVNGYEVQLRRLLNLGYMEIATKTAHTTVPLST
jgi:hypothetical protein